MAKLCLNIGAGTDVRKSDNNVKWINVDIRRIDGIDVVADARQLPFEANSADELLAQDLAEHLPQKDLIPTLHHWYGLVKPGGLLSIRVPDFLKIFRATVTRKLSPEKAFELVFGDQSEGAGGYEYGGHKQALTKEMWAETLRGLEPKPIEIFVEEDPNEFNLYCTVKKPG